MCCECVYFLRAAGGEIEYTGCARGVFGDEQARARYTDIIERPPGCIFVLHPAEPQFRCELDRPDLRFQLLFAFADDFEPRDTSWGKHIWE